MISGRTWSLLQRAAREHRAPVMAVAALLLANVLAYAFVVYPLSQRVTNVADLTAAAETDLADARRQYAQASGLLTGRARATERLDTFYTQVLPANLSAARLIASPRLSQLAERAGVHTRTISGQPVSERGRILTRLDMRMDLTGAYGSVRRFIHLLEQSPEFVVIVNMRIIEGGDEGGELSAQLDLATYFRGAPE